MIASQNSWRPPLTGDLGVVQGIVKLCDHLKAEKHLAYKCACLLWKSLWKIVDQLQKYC